ncbi:sensor histidine kinase [Paenibacillus sp. CC-CFT747]|nr:sensor histidine kinase [Paenibacillus sp. CC-CFT747]
MIKRFVRERLSWIVLVLAVQLLFLFLACLDPAVSLASASYFVFLSLLFFAGFLLLRYPKETRFYRSLADRENNWDPATIAKPSSPFEELAAGTITDQADRLRQLASRHLTAVEREKDELLSWIHEVKTPLTAMHLMIGRMESGPLKSQLTYEWLRIHLLLDQQLHQKRITFIENDLYIEKVHLETILHHEIRTLQAWCMAKGIGFDLQLEVTEVWSDAKWLAFILRQLLSNAVKYSEASDIVIRSCWREERHVIQITDHGRGIDPRDLTRIFDKGFTSTTRHDGTAATGMGLYLSRQAAEPLGITLQSVSRLGEGSTFTLLFARRNAYSEITGM